MLLKNDNHVLPLTGGGQRIAVIGPGAGSQGAEQFYNGNGSGHVPELTGKPDVVSPLQGIQQRASAAGDTVVYADGSNAAAAAATAKLANVAVVFVGAQDSEGVDRTTLDLSSGNCNLAGTCTPQPVDQDQLISQVAAANPHTIVVLNTGGPVVMPWLDQIQGLFEAWYPGQEDGNAIAALLYGDVNPSAKLPETFPRSQADLPTQTAQQFPGVNDAQGIPQSQYSEGLLVGYRWYDAKHIAPLFPFGYGLSYTSFNYSGLKITPATAGAGVTVATASIAVTNTGQRSGADVPAALHRRPSRHRRATQAAEGFPAGSSRRRARPAGELPDRRPGAVLLEHRRFRLAGCAPGATRSWSATTSGTSPSRRPSLSTAPTAPEPRPASARAPPPASGAQHRAACCLTRAARPGRARHDAGSDPADTDRPCPPRSARHGLLLPGRWRRDPGRLPLGQAAAHPAAGLRRAVKGRAVLLLTGQSPLRADRGARRGSPSPLRERT